VSHSVKVGAALDGEGEGDDGDDRKSLGVADEGIANVIIYGDCDVLSKMSGGCTANRCSTDGSTTQDEI